MNEHVVFVGIGSNIEPESNISQALKRLSFVTTVEGLSTFYRTAALMHPELPPFLNGVVRVRTGLEPRRFKSDVLRAIETALGRTRGEDAYVSRTIDLDILLFDSEIIDEPGLRIPDPDIRERPFVAIPLLELVPELILPDTGEEVRELPCARRTEGMIPAFEFTTAMRERFGL